MRREAGVVALPCVAYPGSLPRTQTRAHGCINLNGCASRFKPHRGRSQGCWVLCGSTSQGTRLLCFREFAFNPIE